MFLCSQAEEACRCWAAIATGHVDDSNCPAWVGGSILAEGVYRFTHDTSGADGTVALGRGFTASEGRNTQNHGRQEQFHAAPPISVFGFVLDAISGFGSGARDS